MVGRVFALALAILPVSANAQAFPAFTGYVVDQADVLSPAQEHALAEALGATQRLTRYQIAVVTVPSLGGQAIELYSTALGNHWGLGRRGVNDGVLLVVAPNERKVRIAVGDGLTSTLTDTEAAAIIDRRILPRFKNGRLAAGILSGCAGILRALAPRKV